jgi:hypothetical protein
MPEVLRVRCTGKGAGEGTCTSEGGGEGADEGGAESAGEGGAEGAEEGGAIGVCGATGGMMIKGTSLRNS